MMKKAVVLRTTKKMILKWDERWLFGWTSAHFAVYLGEGRWTRVDRWHVSTLIVNSSILLCWSLGGEKKLCSEWLSTWSLLSEESNKTLNKINVLSLHFSSSLNTCLIVHIQIATRRQIVLFEIVERDQFFLLRQIFQRFGDLNKRKRSTSREEKSIANLFVRFQNAKNISTDEFDDFLFGPFLFGHQIFDQLRVLRRIFETNWGPNQSISDEWFSLSFRDRWTDLSTPS